MLKRIWNWLLSKTTIDERVEETVDNAKNTITVARKKVKEVVKEVKDVVDAVEDAVENVKEELSDVKEALGAGPVIEGKVTKSKLRMLKKSDLLAHARAEFNEELDSTLNKTNLINKVYELHHKK